MGVSGRYLHGLAYGETDFGGELEYFEEDGSTRVVSRDLDLKILQSRSGQGGPLMLVCNGPGLATRGGRERGEHRAGGVD